MRKITSPVIRPSRSAATFVRDMDCDRFRRSLGAFLDGKLEGRACVSLRMHALQCGDCRRLQAARMRLRELVRAANSGEALPHFVTSILERLPHAKIRP